jgi:hypothetical protein
MEVELDNVKKPENLDPKQLKKKKIIKISIIVGVSLLVGILLFVGYWVYFRKGNNFLSNLKQKPSTVSSKIANKLDGRKVDTDKANRHPLAIMVENHPDARPQSGLDKASIVYEAITEGGITRFMAVYGPYDATKVGPVRSARTYFIDWVQSFKAYYAHCGGNLDALDKIKTDGVLDLDQFAVGDKAYWREPQKGKASEHTMFTSTDKLYAVVSSKGWSEANNFVSLKFADAIDATKRTFGQDISIKFSSASYDVSWVYDKVANSYKRTMAGTAHNDGVTGEQLKATNVIIQEVNRHEAPTAINEQGWAMQTTGTGKAMVFSQGVQTDGTWKKTEQTSRTTFYDSTGKEIVFTPGSFWIEIVPPDVYSAIKVTPLTQ